MANVCETKITVIGLKEPAEAFVKALSKAMFGVDLDNLNPKQWGEDENVDGRGWYNKLVGDYRQQRSSARYGILYPHEPYNRLEVIAPRFYVETKWGPPVEKLREASKAFPDLTFHLDWWIEQDGPSGELVIRNGGDIDEICRPSSWYLFDHALLYPRVSLLPAHMPYALAQRAALRVQDAIDCIEGLRRILADDRFKNSHFSECRDREKTENLQAGLDDLHDSMVDQAKRLDFSGVFLEEQDLTKIYPRVIESDKALMQSLGLEPLLPAPDKVVRFSILPFTAATTSAPYRAIVPVVHYLNADPVSGRYVKLPSGSFPPIEWETRHLCLTRTDMTQIKKLPDDDQTPYDIDIAMEQSARRIGHEFSRVSKQARWRTNPELVTEVEENAAEMSDTFAARAANMPGIRLFADFQAVQMALFPRESNRKKPVA